MLPKHLRLSRREVQSLFKSGKRATSPFAYTLTLPSESLKVAVVVPSSRIQLSTTRNKIKRQLFNLLTQHLKELPLIHTVFVIKEIPTHDGDLDGSLNLLINQLHDKNRPQSH